MILIICGWCNGSTSDCGSLSKEFESLTALQIVACVANLCPWRWGLLSEHYSTTLKVKQERTNNTASLRPPSAAIWDDEGELECLMWGNIRHNMGIWIATHDDTYLEKANRVLRDLARVENVRSMPTVRERIGGYTLDIWEDQPLPRAVIRYDVYKEIENNS